MSQPMNPYDSPESLPSGTGGAKKVLLGLGIGCGLMAVICCGGGLVSMYWLGKSIQQATSKDPAKIREVTEQIATIAIPDKFQPETSLDAKIPVIGGMQMAVYRDPNTGATLSLIQFTSDAVAKDRNLRRQLQSSMEPKYTDLHDKKQQVRPETSEEFETTLNGEPAKFTIVEGSVAPASGELLQVSGNFRGKGGFAQLLLEAAKAEFTKEQAIELLKSMK